MDLWQWRQHRIKDVENEGLHAAVATSFCKGIECLALGRKQAQFELLRPASSSGATAAFSHLDEPSSRSETRQPGDTYCYTSRASCWG